MLFLVGAPLTTLFLVTSTVTDPVNAPKLLMAGGLGGSLISIFLVFNLRQAWSRHKFFIAGIVLFLLSCLNATLQSDSPVTQNLYGVFGRNTGFIAYFFLSTIALGALNLRATKGFKQIVWALFFSGFVNVIYCAWVLAFGDFLGWNNPYGNILGLFGNPDFISAFLGIFISALAAYAIGNGVSLKFRISSFAICVVAFYEIHRSHAIQGTAVTVAGLGIVGFFFVKSKFKSKLVPLSYLAISSVLGVLALFGTLQKGPFSFVYKRSVSLRGSYWKTAINMGSENPLSGVGMDSYGDWYRRARPPIALIDTPGINTTSNAAHNVVLDFFAFGGWPLQIAYLVFVAAGAISIIRFSIRHRAYDGVFVTLATAWACYQLQSVISINQIGLAIWGWLLTGALVSYEFVSRNNPESEPKVAQRVERTSTREKQEIVSPQLVAGIGLVVGLILACPPVSADSTWRSALNSQDGNKVLQALKPSYLNPSDTQRYLQATQIFANSNMLVQAHETALAAVSFNPESFDAWRNLYFLSNSSADEKQLALLNLKRLDPLNPDVTKP